MGLGESALWPRLCRAGFARVAVGLALGGMMLIAGSPAGAVELLVLAAGATESTVRDVVETFEKETGHRVKLSYGAVGALRDKIVAGEPADLTIVTPVIIEALQAKGLVRAATRVDLGRVGGGIAVRVGTPRPAIGSPEELKRALLTAESVYYADPATATAGAYFLKVADRLGVGDEVRKKGHTAPGGKEAMMQMAKSKGAAIGLTQISEILSVTEVQFVGPYPGDLQNMTTYTGIVLTRTQQPEAAETLLRFLTSPPVRKRFAEAGFEPPP